MALALGRPPACGGGGCNEPNVPRYRAMVSNETASGPDDAQCAGGIPPVTALCTSTARCKASITDCIGVPPSSAASAAVVMAWILADADAIPA